MRTFYLLAALLCGSLGLASPAWADYCYPGGQAIYDYDQSTNSYSRFRSCQYPGGYELPAGVPPPDYNAGPSAAELRQQYVARQRKLMQENYWAAVAYNTKKRTRSSSIGYETRAAVEKRVLANCAALSAAEDCQLVVVFKNACVAVLDTEFRNAYLIARVRDTKREALDWARQDCKDLGGEYCDDSKYLNLLACSMYGFGDGIAFSDTPNDHLREPPPSELADVPLPKGSAWYIYLPTHPEAIDNIRKEKARKAQQAEQAGQAQ